MLVRFFLAVVHLCVFQWVYRKRLLFFQLGKTLHLLIILKVCRRRAVIIFTTV